MTGPWGVGGAGSLLYRALLPVALLLAPCIGCGGSDAKGSPETDTITLKAGWVLPADHPSSRAMEGFKQRLEKASGGTIRVRLFPSGVLGDATGLIESLKDGNLELALVAAAPLAGYCPDLNALTMPFAFRDREHEYAVLDGELGRDLLGRLGKVGLVGLGYFDTGFRNIMTKQGPVRTPADLAGRKIRVMSSKLMVDTLEALGAAATAMSQGEVYSALQTGVIDGWENNLPTTLAFKMVETGCLYMARTRHLAVPDVLVMGASFMARLDPKRRELVLKVVGETIADQRKLWVQAEKAAAVKLEALGMKFNDVKRGPFASRVVPLYKAWAKKRGQAFGRLCERIQAVR